MKIILVDDYAATKVMRKETLTLEETREHVRRLERRTSFVPRIGDKIEWHKGDNMVLTVTNVLIVYGSIEANDEIMVFGTIGPF